MGIFPDAKELVGFPGSVEQSRLSIQLHFQDGWKDHGVSDACLREFLLDGIILATLLEQLRTIVREDESRLSPWPAAGSLAYLESSRTLPG